MVGDGDGGDDDGPGLVKAGAEGIAEFVEVAVMLEVNLPDDAVDSADAFDLFGCLRLSVDALKAEDVVAAPERAFDGVFERFGALAELNLVADERARFGGGGRSVGSVGEGLDMRRTAGVNRIVRGYTTTR